MLGTCEIGRATCRHCRPELWLLPGTKNGNFFHIFSQKSQIGPHPGRRVMQRAAGALGVCTGMPWVQTDGPMESKVGVEGVFPVGSTELRETGNFPCKVAIDRPPGPNTLSSGPAGWRSFSPLCWAPVRSEERRVGTAGQSCGCCPVPKMGIFFTFFPKNPRSDPTLVGG